MLDISRDIHSLSDFKRNTVEFLDQMEKTGAPMVLTLNGKAKVVVQEATSYQRMLDLLERAETIEAIRQGLEDVKAGRTVSLEQFDKTMRTKHCIPSE